MQLDGILRTWNAERGFGFIAPTHGDNDGVPCEQWWCK
jgi:cold shock CspA family protein